MLAFCNFPLKSIDASHESHRQLHATHSSATPSPFVTSLPKDHVAKVLEENGGKGSDVLTEDRKPFMSQLKKVLFNHLSGHPLLDTERNKAKCLNFVKLKGYKGIGEIHSMDDFE